MLHASATKDPGYLPATGWQYSGVGVDLLFSYLEISGYTIETIVPESNLSDYQCFKI
jgi:hypothetical protein